jgi:hypothetical protein
MTRLGGADWPPGATSETAAATAAIGLSTTVWQAGVLRALAWMARGVRSPARDSLLSSLAPPKAYPSVRRRTCWGQPGSGRWAAPCSVACHCDWHPAGHLVCGHPWGPWPRWPSPLWKWKRADYPPPLVEPSPSTWAPCAALA